MLYLLLFTRLLLCPSDCGQELKFPAINGLEERKLRCLEQMIPVLAPVRTIHCPKCIPIPILARSYMTLSPYSHHLVKNLTDMARIETPWENKTNKLFFRGTVYRTCNSSMIPRDNGNATCQSREGELIFIGTLSALS